jgi:hypothetical protein
MRKLCSVILVLCLLAIFAPTIMAHQIALKDGSVIRFDKYRVVEGQLFYVNSEEKEVQIALSSVDLERTRALSASDSPPLDLPGLMPRNPVAVQSDGQTLGDVAKQVRPKDAKVTSQRTFTDDDVAHNSASSLATSPSSATTVDYYQNTMEQLSKWIRDKTDLTSRQLSDSIVGDNQFPGREDWERRMYGQKEKLVGAVRSATSIVQLMVEAPTAEQKASGKIAANAAVVVVQNERALYDQLVSEGVKKAADWKKLHQ